MRPQSEAGRAALNPARPANQDKLMAGAGTRQPADELLPLACHRCTKASVRALTIARQLA